LKLITTIAGEVTEMQIAFDGISNPDYVKKLAKRVKRGHDGVAREGRSPGALAHGYDAVLGKPGERLINKDEAAIVRRIFVEYASGRRDRCITPIIIKTFYWVGLPWLRCSVFPAFSQAWLRWRSARSAGSWCRFRASPAPASVSCPRASSRIDPDHFPHQRASRRDPRSGRDAVEHDPEKCEAVFRKSSCSNKKMRS
jgi:hypothetical protein